MDEDVELLEGGELINVAGESHYQEALRALCPPGVPGQDVRCDATAELTPEPENPHDPNAVRVTIEGRLVGYLPRQRALDYASLLAVWRRRRRRVACQALISGRATEDESPPMLGVFLRLPPPL